MMGVAGN